jgi:hypothetical protein
MQRLALHVLVREAQHVLAQEEHLRQPAMLSTIREYSSAEDSHRTLLTQESPTERGKYAHSANGTVKGSALHCEGCGCGQK